MLTDSNQRILWVNKELDKISQDKNRLNLQAHT